MYNEITINSKRVVVSSYYKRNGKETFTVVYYDESYSKEFACQNATVSSSRKNVVKKINAFFGENVAELKSYGISFIK